MFDIVLVVVDSLGSLVLLIGELVITVIFVLETLAGLAGLLNFELSPLLKELGVGLCELFNFY